MLLADPNDEVDRNDFIEINKWAESGRHRPPFSFQHFLLGTERGIEFRLVVEEDGDAEGTWREYDPESGTLEPLPREKVMGGIRTTKVLLSGNDVYLRGSAHTLHYSTSRSQ